MKRLLIGVGAALLVIVVLRWVVLPLAQQRETRRRQPASALSMLAPEVTDFVLRRNTFRRISPKLWAEGDAFPLERARSYPMPLDSLAEMASLGLFTGGEWMAASDGERAWLFGPLGRLKARRPEAAALSESDEARWNCAGMILAGRGAFFLAAADEAALAATEGGWLESLPSWPELGDLLVGGDLLAYRREPEGAALLSAKRLGDCVLIDVLAWGEGDLEALVLRSFPLPEAEPGAEPPENTPFLRSTPPWDGSGRPLEPAGQGYSRGKDAGSAMRQWRGEKVLARQHLLDRLG